MGVHLYTDIARSIRTRQNIVAVPLIRTYV